MAVTTPADLPLIDPQDLVGRIEAGAEPLKTIAESTNWLWSQHRPPIAAFAPYCTAKNQLQTYIYPITPSADGITYQLNIAYWADAGSWELRLYHSADAATWTQVVNNSYTDTAGFHWVEPVSPTFTLPASAKYIKLTLTQDTSTNDIQLHYASIQPTQQQPPAGTLPSGFVRFDDALLTAAGGPVYVELLNRCRDNVIAVITDRAQQVASWCMNAENPYRIDPPSHTTFLQVFRCHFEMPGQKGARVRVRAHGAPVGSSTDVLRVGQVLGNKTSAIDLDGTHQSTHLTLQGSTGELYGVVEVLSGSCKLSYVSIDWQPGD